MMFDPRPERAIIPTVTQTISGRFFILNADVFQQNMLGLKRPVLVDNRPVVCVTTSATRAGRFAFLGDSEMIYDGWVYLAQSDTGHYKIGRSQDPFKRIKHFDTIMPVRVEMAAIIPCDNYAQAEKDLQSMFSELRISGEWFDLEQKHIEFIKAILYYIDGRFVHTMNIGSQKEAYGEQPCNSCCVEYRDKLVEDGTLFLWFER